MTRLKTYDVWLDGEIIEQIPCTTLDKDEVQRSLILHDSYNPRIELTEDTHPLSVAFNFYNEATKAWKADENETAKFLDEINERFECPDCFGKDWTGWDIPKQKVICNGCGARVQL